MDQKNSISKSPNSKAVTCLLDYLKSELDLYFEVRIGSLDTNISPEVVAMKITEPNNQIILNGNHPLLKEALSILDSQSNIQTIAKDLEMLEKEMGELEHEREWCDNLPWEVQCGTGYCDANQRKISANCHAQSDKKKKICEEFDLLSQNNETFQKLIKQVCEMTPPRIDEKIESAQKRYEQNGKPERSLAETPAREGSKIYHCLVGGALGDALGRPVERLRSDQMKEYYGEEGIRDLATVGLLARITDDTQMTLFTADGIIKSKLKDPVATEPDYTLIYDSYQNWYKTQTQPFEQGERKGFLANVRDLYSPVGPGRTCLASLASGKMGTIENPINNSNGCGGVLRVAPVGLAYHDPEKAFEIGAKCAALTHGGPEGYLPAGFFAALIASIFNGKGLEESAQESLRILSRYDNYEASYELLFQAIALSKSDVPHKEAIEMLGYGFVGSEAMAISLYCALKNPINLKEALIMAVNHSGDSDSTGSITGNILGLLIGLDTVPTAWIDYLELTGEISKLAMDLSEPGKIENPQQDYPYA